MNYKIGICDADAHYSVNLMEYINMRADIPFQCAAFSNVRAISEYAERNRLDLLLLDENMECDLGLPCVRMTNAEMETGGMAYISKYQRIDDIAAQILHILGARHTEEPSELKVYGVYSPLGRCGKTNLAMGICNRYRDSLYIGLEEYCGISEEAFGQAQRTSEHFWYFLLNKNEEVLSCIDGAPKLGSGFTMLCGPDCCRDYRLLSAEHVKWLYGILRERSAFRRVVFDIGAGSLADIEILDCFDRVFLPVLEDMVSRQKIKRFMSFIDSEMFSVSPEQIISIRVPAADYDSREMIACIEDGGM